jgi:hypothetical protein
MDKFVNMQTHNQTHIVTHKQSYIQTDKQMEQLTHTPTNTKRQKEENI